MSLNRISRRDALLALGLAAMSEARADGGLLRATRVDHVALAVGDVDKALVFYRSLFGNEVLKDSRTPRRYLRLGPCYIAIAPAAAGEAKRIDHIGIGIANFNASALKTSLEGAGSKCGSRTWGFLSKIRMARVYKSGRTSPGNSSRIPRRISSYRHVV